MLALSGLWLFFAAPFWPRKASLLIFVNTAGNRDFSVKQSLSSARFEEWLLKASLKADASTRNKLAESLPQLRQGKLLTIHHLRGPLWEVVWSHSDSNLLGLCLQASRDYLDQAHVGASPVPRPSDELEKDERKLSSFLLAERSGAPTAELDYVNLQDYIQALREQRRVSWQAAREGLSRDLHQPFVRTLEVHPTPANHTGWLYLLVALGWAGMLAQTLKRAKA
ncbi:hypothetical protein JST97_07490 [bacterium]|nr:hypothetical protein [bacterium]